MCLHVLQNVQKCVCSSGEGPRAEGGNGEGFPPLIRALTRRGSADFLYFLVPIWAIVCTYLHIFHFFGDQFRLWHMKSGAFHFEKSFEHSPKASKQLNYVVFNDLSEFVLTICWVFWDLIRVWHMKSGAFHFKKSF